MGTIQRFTVLGVVALGLAVMMVSEASAGGLLSRWRTKPQDPYAAYRPIFDAPSRRPLVASGYRLPTRPLFLSGYAGYNYGRGPRRAFIPTGDGTGYVETVYFAR